MKTLNISLNLTFPKRHIDLIKVLSPFFNLESEDVLNIELTFSEGKGFIYSDNLLLIATILDMLKKRGIMVNIKIIGSNSYAARVNFFTLLGHIVHEAPPNRNSIGRFIEIKPFDPKTMYYLQDELNFILHQIQGISKEVLQLLFYCLAEIIDNTIVHSGLETGWVSAQYFPVKKEIRLIICDTGKGIQKSLSTNPKYSGISEADAVRKSIERGVTDGEGLGFGLFATSRFIMLNEGDLLLYSGKSYLQLAQGRYIVNDGEHWQGTMVYLRINTNVPVDYKDIMPPHHTLPDDYDFFIEKFIGENNELW